MYKRRVVEVVTPGVTLSDKLLDHKKNNDLLSIALDDILWAFIRDFNGEFYVFEFAQLNLVKQIDQLTRWSFLIPKEIKNFWN